MYVCMYVYMYIYKSIDVLSPSPPGPDLLAPRSVAPGIVSTTVPAPMFRFFLSGCIFPSLFSNLKESWLSFPVCVTSVSPKFCTPFPDPFVACTFYVFVWLEP